MDVYDYPFTSGWCNGCLQTTTLLIYWYRWERMKLDILGHDDWLRFVLQWFIGNWIPKIFEQMIQMWWNFFRDRLGVTPEQIGDTTGIRGNPEFWDLTLFRGRLDDATTPWRRNLPVIWFVSWCQTFGWVMHKIWSCRGCHSENRYRLSWRYHGILWCMRVRSYDSLHYYGTYVWCGWRFPKKSVMAIIQAMRENNVPDHILNSGGKSIRCSLKPRWQPLARRAFAGSVYLKCTILFITIVPTTWVKAHELKRCLRSWCC